MNEITKKTLEYYDSQSEQVSGSTVGKEFSEVPEWLLKYLESV